MLTNPRAYKKPKARGRRRRLVAHSHSSSTEQHMPNLEAPVGRVCGELLRLGARLIIPDENKLSCRGGPGRACPIPAAQPDRATIIPWQ